MKWRTRKYNVFSKLSNLYSWDSKFVSTVKTKRKYSWNSNFVSTMEELKSQEKKKIDIYIFLSIMFKKKRTKFFKHQKGVHRTYVTVANQSTVHGTNPTRKKNTISANRYTDNRNASVASPSNKHSERTLLLGDSHSCCISQTFLLDRKT